MWTSNEWSAFGSVLSGAGTLLGAIAVIVAAVLGSKTFENWRRQKLSERKIEQAERILTAAYKVRRGLMHVRNPMLWAYELSAAEKSLEDKGELVGTDEHKKKLTTAQLYFRRMNDQLDNRRALEECLPMARALFGEELEASLEKLNHQFQVVNASVQAQYDFDQNTEVDFRRKIEATLWSGFPSPEENELDKTIAKLVKKIEDACVPVLRLESA